MASIVNNNCLHINSPYIIILSLLKFITHVLLIDHHMRKHFKSKLSTFTCTFEIFSSLNTKSHIFSTSKNIK